MIRAYSKHVTDYAFLIDFVTRATVIRGIGLAGEGRPFSNGKYGIPCENKETLRLSET
jgi:hypothetical protein